MFAMWNMFCLKKNNNYEMVSMVPIVVAEINKKGGLSEAQKYVNTSLKLLHIGSLYFWHKANTIITIQLRCPSTKRLQKYWK